MYHYVRKFNSMYPNFRYLDFDQFIKQLDYFEKNFGFITLDEWSTFIKSGDLPKESGKIVLTFDDALVCQYEFVYPELLKRNLWGIFYIPVSPYVSKEILDVHKIHLLCGRNDGVELLNHINSLIYEDMIPDEKRKEFRERTYSKQSNFEGVTEFKRILNYFIDYKYRKEIINSIAKEFEQDFSFSNFYIDKDKINKMKSNGMIIGSHTMDHQVMSKLSYEDQLFQIKESFRYLTSEFKIQNKTYSHPYGGFHSFDKNTLDILRKEKVTYSFNVESREITGEDYIASMNHLPRFDCNEFPFGTVS